MDFLAGWVFNLVLIHIQATRFSYVNQEESPLEALEKSVWKTD